jgi:hypothetical protein
MKLTIIKTLKENLDIDKFGSKMIDNIARELNLLTAIPIAYNIEPEILETHGIRGLNNLVDNNSQIVGTIWENSYKAVLIIDLSIAHAINSLMLMASETETQQLIAEGGLSEDLRNGLCHITSIFAKSIKDNGYSEIDKNNDLVINNGDSFSIGNLPETGESLETYRVLSFSCKVGTLAKGAVKIMIADTSNSRSIQ